MRSKNAELKIVIFYAGESSIVPRDQLINWLRNPTLKTILRKNLEVATVVDLPVNSNDHIFQRVNSLIDWADKAFAIIAPDSRGIHGGANVIDEMATWKVKKGGGNLCVVRQSTVPPHSNIEGQTYIKYDKDILFEKDNKERILAFLSAEPRIESFNVLDGKNLGNVLMQLAQNFSNEHLRVLLYSGESFKLFTDTFTSPKFKKITLLTRNWNIEREEEEKWNQEVISPRPWSKSSRIKQWHSDLDIEATRGLTIERRFYKNEPGLFFYLFGNKAGVFSYYRKYPVKTIPLDISKKEGGSRYKAWFFPLIEVKRTSKLGQKTLDLLLNIFKEYEKDSITYEQVNKKQ